MKLNRAQYSTIGTHTLAGSRIQCFFSFVSESERLELVTREKRVLFKAYLVTGIGVLLGRDMFVERRSSLWCFGLEAPCLG